jgi:WhiB family redox-sensing transcriptional regulator
VISFGGSAQADHNRIRGFLGTLQGAARYAAASSDWMLQGACQGHDPELFFPIAAVGPALRQISAAKQVCLGCPVSAACLSYALDTAAAGIWGGTTGEERSTIHKRRAAAPESRVLPAIP